MGKFYRFFVIILIISFSIPNCHKNSWPQTPFPPRGPSLGTINDTLTFKAATTDPEGDDIAYQFDWETEDSSDWSDFLNSGDSVTVTHSWQDTGHYNIRVRASDIKDKVSRWSDPHLLAIVISIAPNIPSIFSGPNSGYVNYSYTFSATATDPDEDSISYQFNWGDDSLSNWTSYTQNGDSVQMEHSWLSEGTYNIKTKAKDKYGLESGWSGEHLITISNVPNSPPEVPNTPSGPSSGYEDSTYTFSVTTTDPDGDSISYQFDWGDGDCSEWSNYVSNGQSISIDYSYSSEGTYLIKAKAKDKNEVESGWSNGHQIIISDINYPPNIPVIPSGPSNGYEDSTYNFSAVTTDPDGDSISYQFDWGDTNLSAWSNYVSSGQSVSLNHSYSSPGIYSVTAKAKDVDGAESDWSDGHQITISINNNPPNIPAEPTGPSMGHEDSTYTFFTSTTDPDGDSISYQFDWGDDSSSPWSPYVPSGDSVQMNYSWSSEGRYEVRVKAKDKYEIEPGWSPKHSITITRMKWNFSTGNDVLSSPAIGSDGTIYVGSHDNNVYAINPDGTEKWTFPTGDDVFSSPAISSDGTIYVGSYDGNLYAINPDGTEKWAFSTGDGIQSSPAIGSDGTIYVGSWDNNLYAINPDGTEKWTFTTGSTLRSSPVIGSDGTIYLGSNDKNLYAINPDGTEKWIFSTGSSVFSSPAIGNDSTIYVGSWDHNLYAINPDGTEKWTFTTGNRINSSPAIGSDGTIYVGSWDYGLYAINPDGTEKWIFSTGGSVLSSPAIGNDGTIYVGSYDYNLHALNPDGTEKRIFLTNGVVISSPIIENDGTIYVGSWDNNIYAFLSSSVGLAATPWPMFHHDLKHTGRAGEP